MSRIYDFFLDIKNNPMDYVGRSSNSDFEKQVINQLEMFGYYETDFNELGNSYRTYWRALIESDDGIIKNVTQFKQMKCIRLFRPLFRKVKIRFAVEIP